MDSSGNLALSLALWPDSCLGLSAPTGMRILIIPRSSVYTCLGWVCPEVELGLGDRRMREMGHPPPTHTHTVALTRLDAVHTAHPRPPPSIQYLGVLEPDCHVGI